MRLHENSPLARPPGCRGAVAALVLLLSCPAAHAALEIEVTSGVRDPVPIAIVPFAHGAAEVPVDVASVIQHDLEGSGRFKALPQERMPATPARVEEVATAAWKAVGSDYVVVGRVTAMDAGGFAVDFDLINTLTGSRLAGQRFTGSASALRNAAHRTSDVIYQKILGVRGAFATRIAYVAVDGEPPAQTFRLLVADADGANQQRILEYRYPIMSPAWSPDGQWLAYVSFESKHSAVYVQLVRTGERRLVSARAGVNGAPVWSPDGKRLALTLGASSGNLDIYVLDLTSQALTKITDDPAIDTEPEWAPDGRSLYFTSDRAGSPQIYQIGIQPGARPKRITFGCSYCARPRISPDGTLLGMVTLDKGSYRIAVQELASGSMRTLSRGRLDESPSFAPNGATLIYSERESGRGELATVSTDGLTGLRLKASEGEIREPAWGPFIP
jgi:TolB protein